MLLNLAESAWQRLTGLTPFPQPHVVPLRLPVILMHGFGILAGLRRGGHLHDEALYLRSHGVRAYAPNVAPYNTVSVRTEMWKQRIQEVLDQTGVDRVHLVAHSMGGLDARHLISCHGLHDVVASLTTVSTPHRGTAISDIIQEQPERMREWAAQLFNWMGTAAMAEVTADVTQAVAELTPVHCCDRFNSDAPDHPSVRYWSYAGAAGKGTDTAINPLLRIQNAMLYKREGINDGLVAVDSARWGTFLGTIPADHSQQVGINLLPGNAFDSNGFYLSIVEMLYQEFDK